MIIDIDWNKMKPKISIITLGASDLARSLKFYKDLGFNTHSYKDGDDSILFELEGTWLSLYPKEKLADDATISPIGSGFGGITLAHNVASKEQVESVFQHMLNMGAISIKIPQDVFWGGYSGYIADPDGYLWEIAYNPFTDLS
jgi:uncharacterized protein